MDNQTKRGPLDRFFRLSERGTNVKTEIFAGLLMFFEVICTAAVSAQLVASNAGIPSFSTVYFGMILAALVGTILMGLLCNAPLMQSVSMGAVILIVTTLSSNLGLTLSNVLMLAFAANLIYLAVMLIKPVRRFVFNAVPAQIKKVLPAALGAYLLVYAVSQLKLLSVSVTDYSTVLESMAAAGERLSFWGTSSLNFAVPDSAVYGWYAATAVITAAVGLVAMLVLKARRVKHAPMWSLIAAFVVFVLLWALRANFQDYYFYAFFTPAYGGMYFYDGVSRISGEYKASLFAKLFGEGFDFTMYKNYLNYLESQATGLSVDAVSVNAGGKLLGVCVTTILSFLALGVSETGAGLHGSAYAADALDENGRPIYQSGGLLQKLGDCGDVYGVNAFSSLLGCVLGAGPVSVRGESVLGAKEGGKTGLSAIVAGLLCIVALFNLIFSALFLDGNIVMGLLIAAGLGLLSALRYCDFSDAVSAIPALVMVAAAGLRQSLSAAILLGITVDTVIRLLAGKAKEIAPGAYLFSAASLVCGVIGLL